MPKAESGCPVPVLYLSFSVAWRRKGRFPSQNQHHHSDHGYSQGGCRPSLKANLSCTALLQLQVQGCSCGASTQRTPGTHRGRWFLQLVGLCNPGTAAAWLLLRLRVETPPQGAAPPTKLWATPLGRRRKITKRLTVGLTASFGMSRSSHNYCCKVTFSSFKHTNKINGLLQNHRITE